MSQSPAEFTASHRFARMGCQKARRVVALIRGCSASRALDILRNDPHRAAPMVRKVLASAVANAMQNPGVKASRLVVSRVFVQGGPLLQGRFRFRPGPMGRAMPIRRRTCHIHVFVADPAVEMPAGDSTQASAASAAGGGQE